MTTEPSSTCAGATGAPAVSSNPARSPLLLRTRRSGPVLTAAHQEQSSLLLFFLSKGLAWGTREGGLVDCFADQVKAGHVRGCWVAVSLCHQGPAEVWGGWASLLPGLRDGERVWMSPLVSVSPCRALLVSLPGQHRINMPTPEASLDPRWPTRDSPSRPLAVRWPSAVTQVLTSKLLVRCVLLL